MSWFNNIAEKAENLLNRIDHNAGIALQQGNSARNQNITFRNTSSDLGFSEGYLGEGHGEKLLPSLQIDAISCGSSSGKNQDHHHLREPSSFAPLSLSRSLPLLNKGAVDQIEEDTNQRGLGFTTRKTHKVNSSDQSLAFFDSGWFTSSQESVSPATQLKLSAANNQPEMDVENRLLRNEVQSLNQELTRLLQRANAAEKETENFRLQLSQAQGMVELNKETALLMEGNVAHLKQLIIQKEAELSRYKEAQQQEQKQKERTGQREDAVGSGEGESVHLQCRSSAADEQTGAGGRPRFEEEDMQQYQLKIAQLEIELEKERQTKEFTENGLKQRIDQLEMELNEQLSELQRAEEEKECSLRSEALLRKGLESSEETAMTLKNDLANYKTRAEKILLGKDRLIESLQQNAESISDATHCGDSILEVELQSSKQEIELLKEDCLHLRIQLDTAKNDLSQAERRHTASADTANDFRKKLEHQCDNERQRRIALEEEIKRHVEEVHSVRDGCDRLETSMKALLAERDSEIVRLRNQLTSKRLNSETEQMLENRVHSLTENLLQKQMMVEKLASERNSLVLQLEYAEKKRLNDLELQSLSSSVGLGPGGGLGTSLALAGVSSASAGGSNSFHLSSSSSLKHLQNRTDDAKAHVLNFLVESPFDGNVTKRVKRAYSCLDAFSIRLGVFFRRYPAARAFFLFYVAVLHIWVVFILFTYTPEMH